MSNPVAKTPDFGHRWYLREWMAVRGKRQVDMQTELGWSKGKANEVYNGQRYTQDLVDDLWPWLDIEPFELLMSPTVALNIRSMRESAEAIVRQTPPPTQPARRQG